MVVRMLLRGDNTVELNEPTTLLSAVGVYVGSLKDTDDAVHNELSRFVGWCGPERDLAGIAPSVIGGYADSVAGTGTTPLAAERLQVVRKFLTYAKKKGMIEINLAQHVRIRKPRVRKTQGGQAVDRDEVGLTPEGHAQLVTQLDELKSQRVPLAVEIQKAAADKDVRENSPLEAAREQLGQVEARIREIEATLLKAVILYPKAAKDAVVVGLGTVVWVQDVDSGRKSRYTVVSASEANPMDSKISDVSPLGKAFLGKLKGGEAQAETPRGTVRYKILGVS
ncbi:MAG TPA: hypothetical protein DCP37_15725 [Dehalococcoidia bacterium]|nr:hypothetical protein [Dehalococcoidia bacterium]